jgi:hypothetical protein
MWSPSEYPPSGYTCCTMALAFIEALKGENRPRTTLGYLKCYCVRSCSVGIRFEFIVTDKFCCFPQSFQAQFVKIRHEQLLPDPFQFTAHTYILICFGVKYHVQLIYRH